MITMGIDIGSTTSKCIILNDGQQIIGSSLVKSGIGTDGPQEAFERALEKSGIKEGDLSRVIATGYGRAIWKGAHDTVSELTAHAIGSYFLFPKVRTIIDIGGQDAKVISLNDEGKMADFVMNDKCAAGTGRFLDVMAGILKLRVEELEKVAAQSTAMVSISSTCTVFAESEVISQLASGAPVPDVVLGICHSVAGRVASLARRVGICEQVCMSGGVAQNGGVRGAMEQVLGVQIVYSPLAQLTGAIGAALHAYNNVMS